jgi:hypothetical protein
VGAVAAVAAGIAATVHAPGPGPQGATTPATSATGANVWVDPSGGSCARTSAPAVWADRDACPTIDSAYRAARPGDSVRLKGGTYPGDQKVLADPEKRGAAQDVTILPAEGDKVVLAGSLLFYGSHAVVSDLQMRYLFAQATRGPDNQRDVTYRNITARGFTVTPVAGPVTIADSSFGPNLLHCAGVDEYENKISQSTINESGKAFVGVPTDVTLQRLRIFGQQSADLDCQHVGGLMLTGGQGITIRDTVFSRNMVYDMEVDRADAVVLENNWFGAPVDRDGRSNDHQFEVQLTARPGVGSGSYSDWLVRHNSFRNGIGTNFSLGAHHRDFRVVGNVGAASDCGVAPDVTWAYNLWTDKRCSSTDALTSQLPYIDERIGHEDFHLTPGSPAEGLVAGHGADYALGEDVDGRPRPQQRARDAGASQSR